MVPFLSQILPGRPEQDLVDVHVLWSAEGERRGAREGIGWNRRLILELANPLGRVRVDYAALHPIRRYYLH
jgi:hypothetical protein